MELGRNCEVRRKKLMEEIGSEIRRDRVENEKQLGIEYEHFVLSFLLFHLEFFFDYIIFEKLYFS